MFEDEKANQYDSPVLSFKCDIGKMSVIMHFFSEYVFFEMTDDSGKLYGEMKPPMMPEDEYDELPMHDKANQASIVQGDGLILCKKTEADFASSKDYYAIYDNNSEKWIMDYTECDGLRENPYFMYCGSNMFSYGDSASYLLSPNHKGPIKTDINSNTSGLSMWGYNGYWFYGGHTIVNAYVDGKDKFCVLEDTGKLTPLDFPKTKQRLIGRYCCDEDCFVFYTRNSINDPVEEMVIYEYSTGKFIIIKDTDYTHQLDTKRYSSQITFEDDKISYDFKGADGNVYHSEFDKNGNLVTPAEQID